MKNNISIELAIGRIPAAACADRRLRTPRQQDVSLQCTTCTLMPCHQLRTDPTPPSQRDASSNTAAQACHLSQTWVPAAFLIGSRKNYSKQSGSLTCLVTV